MKKVNSINEIGHKGIFIKQSNGQLKSLELKDISVMQHPVRWEELPIGCKYYEAESIQGKNRPFVDFHFGGKGIVITKLTKFDKNTHGMKALRLPIVNPIQRETPCYQAKDRSPDIVAIKMMEA